MTAVAIALDTVVAPSEDAVFREIDGQSVLLNLATGMYFGLDAVGTHVWELAEAHGSLDAVCRRLIDEYDADPATIERDLLALAETLVARGLWSIR
jgi:Coenzyme PQQ synthesis protein D (PqqD)